MKKVTISDVAKKAKVSNATVSRVMSGSPVISKNTQKIVQKAIEELNYYPSSIAQNLTKSNTNIIGIVLNSQHIDPLSNNFFSEVISTISDRLLENEYYTLYIHCNDNEKEFDNIQSLVRTKRVDGLIFLRAYEDEKVFKYLQKIDFPFSIIGTPQNTENYLWVDNDNIKTSYEITTRTINEGRKNICFLGGSKNLNVTKFRFLGFEKAFQENNLKIKREYILESNFTENEAYNITSKFLDKYENEVDAIITTDDVLAIGVTNALYDRKITNVKVTGYNNIPLREYGKYTFETVDINVKKLGLAVCELLINKLKKVENKINFSIIDTNIIE